MDLTKVYSDIDKETDFEMKIELIKETKKYLGERKKKLEELLIMLDTENVSNEPCKLSINKLFTKISEAESIEKKVKFFLKLDGKVSQLENELFSK